MTDRQLLELAAAAAGLSPDLFTWDEQTECIKYQYKSELTDGHLWNPLTDDGDALRLAVKLGIHLQFAMDYAVAYAGSVHAKQFTERCGNDEKAATRRAIVRAAAEIGKAA